MVFWESMNEKTRLIVKIAAVTLGVYLGFRYILPLVLPFLFAYFLAWVVRPATEFLYKKVKIPRIIGGSISLAVLVSVLGAGLVYLGNMLIKQAVSFVRNIPIYLNILADKLDNMCSDCDEIFGLAVGSARKMVDDNIMNIIDKVKTDIIPGMTAKTLNFAIRMIAFAGILLLVFASAVLISKEVPEIKKKYENAGLYRDISRITIRLADAGIAYMRAQLIIMVFVAACCTTGLVIIGNAYALLIGIIVAILDALPFIGSGMVLIPWSIIMLINGNIFAAAVLFTVYLVCQIIREIAEPRLIGNRIGIRPLYTLISMFIGFKLFGAAGFILGPIGLILIIAILTAKPVPAL